MPSLIDELTRRYGPCLLQRHGQTYPVCVFPAAVGQTLDSVLGHPPNDFRLESRFAAYSAEHLADRRGDGRTLFNGLCYSAAAIRHDPPQIDGALCTYFDMIATCDALDHELRDFAAGRRLDTPLRDALHRVVPEHNIMVDTVGRACVIGVATLTVFPLRGEPHLILGQRRDDLATGSGMLHVLPAFVFQPMSMADAAQSWSVRAGVLREYGEELFGVAETTPHAASSPEPAPPVAELMAMLADGRAALHLTGLVFNLLSLRFEVTVLLHIHDPEWYERSEAALQAASHTERQATFYLPLATLDGLPPDLPARITPQGAAAFWLGVEAAHAHLGGISGVDI